MCIGEIPTDTNTHIYRHTHTHTHTHASRARLHTHKQQTQSQLIVNKCQTAFIGFLIFTQLCVRSVEVLEIYLNKTCHPPLQSPAVQSHGSVCDPRLPLDTWPVHSQQQGLGSSLHNSHLATRDFHLSCPLSPQWRGELAFIICSVCCILNIYLIKSQCICIRSLASFVSNSRILIGPHSRTQLRRI